jgi:hypothetical protein
MPTLFLTELASVFGKLFLFFVLFLLCFHLLLRKTITLVSFVNCCYQSFISATSIGFGYQLLIFHIDGLSQVFQSSINGDLFISMFFTGTVFLGGGMLEICRFCRLLYHNNSRQPKSYSNYVSLNQHNSLDTEQHTSFYQSLCSDQFFSYQTSTLVQISLLDFEYTIAFVT